MEENKCIRGDVDVWDDIFKSHLRVCHDKYQDFVGKLNTAYLDFCGSTSDNDLELVIVEFMDKIDKFSIDLVFELKEYLIKVIKERNKIEEVRNSL